MYGAKQDEKVKKNTYPKIQSFYIYSSYNIQVASRQKDNPKYRLLVKFRIRKKE